MFQSSMLFFNLLHTVPTNLSIIFLPRSEAHSTLPYLCPSFLAFLRIYVSNNDHVSCLYLNGLVGEPVIKVKQEESQFLRFKTGY